MTTFRHRLLCAKADASLFRARVRAFLQHNPHCRDRELYENTFGRLGFPLRWKQKWEYVVLRATAFGWGPVEYQKDLDQITAISTAINYLTDYRHYGFNIAAESTPEKIVWVSDSLIYRVIVQKEAP